jgi:glutaconate CoA-transferase subunit B
MNQAVESDYGAPEMMAVVMARLVSNGMLAFVGVNSPLPYVAVSLARKLHAPDCTFVSISGGINAEPPVLVPNTSSAELAVGSASILDNQELYALNGRGKIDLTFLGMAQIDARARVNSSFIGDPSKPKVRFPGGGGGPAIMPKAKQAVLWRADHSRKIFVQEVGFVTASGNVHRVVTPLCVFCKDEGRLVLHSVHPGVSREELADKTGFEIPNLYTAPVTPPLTAIELSTLRAVDPQNVRSAEFSL